MWHRVGRLPSLPVGLLLLVPAALGRLRNLPALYLAVKAEREHPAPTTQPAEPDRAGNRRDTRHTPTAGVKTGRDDRRKER
jgi:hypothetical protein